MIFNLECIICIRNYKDIILDYKIILHSAFSIFSNVREVNLVYPIHNGSCHKQQMINNDKLNHGKPQLHLSHCVNAVLDGMIFRVAVSQALVKKKKKSKRVVLFLIVFILQLLCIENTNEQFPDMNFCHPLQENISRPPAYRFFFSGYATEVINLITFLLCSNEFILYISSCNFSYFLT
jgi:hypothetical protein